MQNLVTDTKISARIKAAVNDILAELPDIESEDGYNIDYYSDIQEVVPTINSHVDSFNYIEDFIYENYSSYENNALLAAIIHYAYELGFNQAHNSANIEEEV